MKEAFSRTVDIVSQEGFATLFGKIPGYTYRNTIRPLLPRKRYLTYNDVTVCRPVIVGDRYFNQAGNWYEHDFDRDQYETALVAGLRRHCQRGDDVVIVGGGWGVTSVVAARQVGPEGAVTVYEGSLEQVERTRKTIAMNGLEDVCTVKHAVVSEAIALQGEAGQADTVSPGELPDCDVLELDCEGAEVKILEKMEVVPRLLLVESHGQYDASSDTIERIVRENGYEVLNTSIAEVDRSSFCEKNDIRVLVATDKGW